MAAVVCTVERTVDTFVDGLWAVYEGNAHFHPQFLEQHLKDLTKLQTEYSAAEFVSDMLFRYATELLSLTDVTLG